MRVYFLDQYWKVEEKEGGEFDKYDSPYLVLSSGGMHLDVPDYLDAYNEIKEKIKA